MGPYDPKFVSENPTCVSVALRRPWSVTAVAPVMLDEGKGHNWGIIWFNLMVWYYTDTKKHSNFVLAILILLEYTVVIYSDIISPISKSKQLLLYVFWLKLVCPKTNWKTTKEKSYSHIPVTYKWKFSGPQAALTIISTLRINISYKSQANMVYHMPVPDSAHAPVEGSRDNGRNLIHGLGTRNQAWELWTQEGTL